MKLSLEEACSEDAFLAGIRRQTLSGWVLRYGLAITAVAAATGSKLALEAWVGSGLSAYALFYPAVMAAALVAGFGPGLAATALAGVVAGYYILPPVGQLAIDSPADRLGLVIFTGTGMFMSALAEIFRRCQDKAVAYDRETALRESRSRLAAFADATFEGIIESESGRIVDCNEQLARMLGYTVAELQSRELAGLIAPEDLDRVMANIGQDREPVIELAMLRKDGTRIDVEVHGHPVSPGSATRHTSVLEITKRKQARQALRDSEDRLRFAMETSRTGIWDLDLADHTAFSSLETSRIFGYQELTPQWSYELFIEHVLPEDRAAVEGEFRRAMQNRSDWSFECRIRRTDGRIRWVWVAGRHRLDAAGALTRMAGIVQDITERKQAEQEILKLSEDMAARNLELESTNKEMESFVYSVSHDLRAPIRTMSGFAKIISEEYSGKLDGEGQDYLNRILKGSEKATRLIDDLLRLSRVSRQDMVLIDVDLSKTAVSVMAELRETDPARNVDVAIAPGLTALADPVLATVVLSNLLGNAWKFTSKTENARIEFGKLACEAPPTGTFEGRLHADCGIKPEIANSKSEIEKTVYYVKDNGAGFDPAHADKMFWPFYRLHPDTEFEGTGIGLAIVERIVRRHGGRIWAEGEVGKGATLYFTLC